MAGNKMAFLHPKKPMKSTFIFVTPKERKGILGMDANELKIVFCTTQNHFPYINFS
jgi:hypothetical protein